VVHRREILVVAHDFGRHLRKGVHVLRDAAVVLIEEFKPLRANPLEIATSMRTGLAGDTPERGRVEIVVGEDDVAKAHLVQLVHLFDNLVGKTLARLAAVGHPD
jgi:hypothetical protein